MSALCATEHIPSDVCQTQADRELVTAPTASSTAFDQDAVYDTVPPSSRPFTISLRLVLRLETPVRHDLSRPLIRSSALPELAREVAEHDSDMRSWF